MSAVRIDPLLDLRIDDYHLASAEWTIEQYRELIDELLVLAAAQETEIRHLHAQGESRRGRDL